MGQSEPPVVYLLWCPKCGHTDRHTSLKERHFSDGKLCEGKPIRMIAERTERNSDFPRLMDQRLPMGRTDRSAYRPWDQEQKLGEPPWKSDDPKVRAWEHAHGHDVRLKCYPEFGCQLLEGEIVREIAAWLRHVDRLDEIPGAKLGLPQLNPLWDAADAIEREFGDA